MSQHEQKQTASPVKLSDWSVVSLDPSGYSAPEACVRVLRGAVRGHRRFQDGHRVLTSRIIAVSGRMITTSSGSSYELVGDPDLQYLEYLDSIGMRYNAEEPIKVKT